MTTAGVVLALSLAPAALAQTAKPAAGAPSLATVQAVFHVGASEKRDRSRSCAKGAKRSAVRVMGSPATADLARKAVVACEQPPRSQPLTIGALKHAQAVLNALIG